MHELFKKRRSIRKYTSQKVSDEQIKEILSAAMVAPSAQNLHPVDFLVIKDRDKLEKLSKCGSFQRFVKNASVAIVVVADPAKSESFWLIDATLAAAHIYLEVTSQGLATCWANIYLGKTDSDKDREIYTRKVLGIPENKKVVCIFPIGYPAEKPKDHDETEYDEDRVHWGRW